MKVAVIGANGQLGTDLVTAFQRADHEVVALTHEDIHVEEASSVDSVLTAIRPDAVLNTAAFHVVPQCENEPALAFTINAIASLYLARRSDALGAIYVYFSTDYVFDGAKQSPYVETDRPNPLNVYATSKLAGESFALNYARQGYAIRVSGIYGKIPCRAKGGNFITTMLRLAREKPEVSVVTDEILTPTPTEAIAERTVDILTAGQPGLYHLTCEGECSWYEFAREIFSELQLTTPLLPTTVNAMPSPVKRPFYSVLDNAALRAAGIAPMPHWRDALRDFLRHNVAI